MIRHASQTPWVDVVLMHEHVVNRNGEAVVTSVTNIDLHDISRSATTYGVRTFWIVTPLAPQHELVERIVRHWEKAVAVSYHPDRATALRCIRVARSFDEVQEAGSLKPMETRVVLTDARPDPSSRSYEELREEMSAATQVKRWILVFGTGWGIAPSFMSKVDVRLEPIYGCRRDRLGYNHLSVRAAVAIILDRLMGHRGFD